MVNKTYSNDLTPKYYQFMTTSQMCGKQKRHLDTMQCFTTILKLTGDKTSPYEIQKKTT